MAPSVLALGVLSKPLEHGSVRKLRHFATGGCLTVLKLEKFLDVVCRVPQESLSCYAAFQQLSWTLEAGAGEYLSLQPIECWTKLQIKIFPQNTCSLYQPGWNPCLIPHTLYAPPFLRETMPHIVLDLCRCRSFVATLPIECCNRALVLPQLFVLP